MDLDALVETYCSDSVDAQLDEIAYTVSDEVWGYGFDVAAAKTWLQSAPYGQTLSLPLTYQAPAITRPALEATLFPDVLAAAQTHYYYHPERTTNLVVACRTINQLIIKPGETFSFNDTLGQRTEEKGYQPAGAYAGGQTVLQVGGGICQVASTLYYCTLYADLEVLEREEHMYTSDYLPLGMDATVNWGTIDFRFRNNTDHPIRIEAKAEDGYVTVTLMGTDDKTYYIEMDYKVIKEYPWKTVEKEMEADNEEGYVDGDVILSGWTGYSVDTYKYKYDKQTDELISKTIESHSEYESRDKQICRIRQDETLPPETTIPPETTLPPETTVAPETDTSDPAA